MGRTTPDTDHPTDLAPTSYLTPVSENPTYTFQATIQGPDTYSVTLSGPAGFVADSAAYFADAFRRATTPPIQFPTGDLHRGSGYDQG